MPTRTLRPIDPLLRRYVRDLIEHRIIRVNDGMDTYRRAAGASFHDLERLSKQIGDHDLEIVASVWHAIMVGRAGSLQPPGWQHLVALAYLLDLELEDLGRGATEHPSMAGALARLKRVRAAA